MNTSRGINQNYTTMKMFTLWINPIKPRVLECTVNRGMFYIATGALEVIASFWYLPGRPGASVRLLDSFSKAPSIIGRKTC